MITERLRQEQDLTDEEFLRLLSGEEEKELIAAADEVRRENYGDEVYVRGLIEFTNYCRNDCYYCGIRRSNRKVDRYRLDRETILSCCREGYELGYRTFVLQGGEDPYYTDEILCDIVLAIHEEFLDHVGGDLGQRTVAQCRIYVFIEVAAIPRQRGGFQHAFFVVFQQRFLFLFLHDVGIADIEGL